MEHEEESQETISKEIVEKANKNSKSRIDEYGRECSKCNDYKSWKEYATSNKESTRHTSRCKACDLLYRKTNAEAIKATSTRYREMNSDLLKQKKKEYYLKNKDSISKRAQKYREENKEKIFISKKKYREENKEKIYLSKKKYREENKEAIKAKKSSDTYKENRNEQRRIRYNQDQNYKIESILRSRLVTALKVQKAYKANRTMELLGCSIEEFKKYIEDRWLPGMSWDNHSLEGWHLDHIIPVSSWNLLDPQQQKECFHYTNMQPLWAIDNLQKSNKIIN